MYIGTQTKNNMKTFKYFLVAIIAISVSVATSAQMDHSKMNMKTETSATNTEKVKVSGNCESCKDRIEKATKIPGVTKADWSIKTKVLTVTYDPKKVTIDAIQKSIAAVGHDTPKYKASDKVYNTLPGCCKYR